MSREVARWTFAGGSREAGAIEYADGHLFVHHDTCPARGNNSAWDLVRKHRYGELDKDCPPDMPIGQRPSQKAMIEFAESLPEVRAARAKEEMTNMGEAAPETPDPFAGTEALRLPSFSLLDVDEFADTPDEQPNDQVAGVIPSVGVGQMIAPSGSGKSFVAIDVAAHVALGKEYHDRKVAKGRALYICAEGARGAKKRFRAWKKHHNVAGFDGGIRVLTAAPNLHKPKQIGELIESIRAAMPGVTLIIFDTRWRCATGSDENSASDQAVIFASADLLAREFNAFVLLLAHTGYGDQTRARGSSAQYAACDTELTVERNGDYCKVRVSKSKDSEGGTELSFKSIIVDLGSNAHGEPESSLVLAPVDPVERALAFKPNGKLEKAVYDYVLESGASRFAREELISEVAEKSGSRPATIRRAIGTSLARSLFLGNGDDLTVRPGIVRDNSGWLT